METVVFYLKALAETHQLGLEVKSERTVKPKRNAMRPDISIWSNGGIVASIECKTQLGWNRDNWESDFLLRQKRLREDYPMARSFLLVATANNWPGFGGKPQLGTQYFVLSRVWPGEINLENIDGVIENPIEGLFKQIMTS